MHPVFARDRTKRCASAQSQFNQTTPFSLRSMATRRALPYFFCCCHENLAMEGTVPPIIANDRHARNTAPSRRLLWTELDGLIYVNAVLDCADRECIGRNVSQRNDAKEAAWALEDALLRRFGTLPTGEDIGITLRTDNALVYASELYRRLVAEYGLRQEFILPHTPEQNGVIESFMGTLKLECIWQHRFRAFDEAKRVIEAWIDHYNERRPHSRLGYVPPSEWRLRQSQITA